MTTHTPTEDAIARTMAFAGSDPRTLAIAALRAQHALREARTEIAYMRDLQDLTFAAMAGDMDGAALAISKNKQRRFTGR